MQKSSRQQSSSLIVFGVVVCFILSGFAALLYQTAWMRQFSLVFGTSELAIAAVLSAYMGGLAFGSIVAARYVDRITRPVLFYGVLEAGIAISALAVPWLLKLASLLYIAMLGGQPEPVDASGLGQSLFYLIIAFIVLAIPTSFMGATLPLLTKYVVQRKEQIGSRVGLLYATNTMGAIGGTVVAGFVLLPLLGLNGTVWVGVVINLLVFVLAALIARYIGDHSKLNEPSNKKSKQKESPQNQAETAPKFRLWILPLMLFSGANSFLYEVLWTRLLGHILGGSITAFATMLAGFLSGIAIGSAIASRFAQTRKQATLLFVLVQCGIAAMSMLIYQTLPLIVPETAGLDGNVVLAILVLLPATIFIGATFPLAVRILAAEKEDAAPSSARVYSWNTVGAIFGAITAVFFLIPALKYEGAIKFAVLLNVILALGAAFLVYQYKRQLVVAASLFALVVVIFYQPKMPEAVLRASAVYPAKGGEIQFYEVGRSSTVLVIEEDGFYNLRNNGLPEASAQVKGAPPTTRTQRMLGIMPVLARPDAESMLIVGLGGAVVLEGIPASIEEIDVIELESEVVTANHSYGDKREVDPLKDPRVNIFINDARSALTLTSKRYDAIVSQPSHPWTAGASHLYTREFMALAKQHLTEDGVYLQWMNTQFTDEFLLRSLTATMLDVYPYVNVYQWRAESLFFLGSDQPIEPEKVIALTGKPLTDDVLNYLENGVGSAEDVIAALTMDQINAEAFASEGVLITDNNNHMATRSSRVIDTQNALRGSRLYNLLKPYDPLLKSSSTIRSGFPVDLNFAHISRRLEMMGTKVRAIDLANSLVDHREPSGLAIIGVGQRTQGDNEESQKNLLRAVQADPTDQQARFALLTPWFGEIHAGEEVPAYVTEQVAMLTGTAAAVVEGYYAAANGDMRSVVELDPALARVRPSDMWYDMSVKLRVDWRIRLTNPEYQPRMANEATALIDSALVFSFDTSWYLLRMSSTLLAGDHVGTVESATIIVNRLDADIGSVESGEAPINLGGINLSVSQLNSVDSMLRQIPSSDAVPEQRLEALSADVSDLVQRLNAL